jgi:hypothetical protein
MPIRFSNPKLLPINLKISKVEKEIEIARSFLEDATDLPADKGRYVSRLLGLAVHNVYNGIEQIFEDVAKELDGGKPKGDTTHADLLQLMAVETPYRPAMIEMTDLDGPGSFDDLRRFRHVVRHSYGMELREAEVRDKFTAATDRIWPAVIASLERLRDHLDKDVEDKPDPQSSLDDTGLDL